MKFVNVLKNDMLIFSCHSPMNRIFIHMCLGIVGVMVNEECIPHFNVQRKSFEAGRTQSLLYFRLLCLSSPFLSHRHTSSFSDSTTLVPSSSLRHSCSMP